MRITTPRLIFLLVFVLSAILLGLDAVSQTVSYGIGTSPPAQKIETREFGVAEEVAFSVNVDPAMHNLVTAISIEANWDSTHFEYVTVEVSNHLRDWVYYENEEDVDTGRYRVAFASAEQMIEDSTLITIRLRTRDVSATGAVVFNLQLDEDPLILQTNYYIIDESLPVELVDLRWRMASNHLVLEWSTLSETNNSHFEVYAIGHCWQPDGRFIECRRQFLGRVEGHGTTLDRIDYRQSYNMTSGLYKIQIIQHDFDGLWRSYFTLFFDVDLERNLTLWPNPTEGGLNIKYTTKTPEDVRIDLFDVQGRHIRSLYEAETNAELYLYQVLDFLGSGHYFIRVTSPNVTITKPFVKL